MPTPFAFSGSTSTGIASAIEAGVRSGELAPGDQLPAVRTLAVHLTVSPGTVAAAYRMLRQRGVVETGGRRGTQVRAAPTVTARLNLRLPVRSAPATCPAAARTPACCPGSARICAGWSPSRCSTAGRSRPSNRWRRWPVTASPRTASTRPR
ncbi:GntR family transcriptional regulator [Fodinicola feengrottensis]|uniref:GntR family transcriptional regulator n=1 Tax=Fodinicola feengrottensis TaxID=435914 RepID=UPI0028BE5805|nr:GntR family transcriptional regulator [Fodinicola feengrottensis]